MKKIRTRFLSAFLALLTLLTLLPTSALAASGSGTGIKPTTDPNLWSTRLTSTGQQYSYRPPTAAGKQLYCMDLGYSYRFGTASFLNSYTYKSATGTDSDTLWDSAVADTGLGEMDAITRENVKWMMTYITDYKGDIPGSLFMALQTYIWDHQSNKSAGGDTSGDIDAGGYANADTYEIINPYEGNPINNTNLFISQYCAAKELDFASIALADMEQILRAGLTHLYSFSRTREVRTIPAEEDGADDTTEIWYIYTIRYNGEAYFADTIFALTDKQKELAENYAENLSLFLGDGLFQYAPSTNTITALGNVRFTDGATDVVYFNQLDERYANQPYGTDHIGGYGCGPTSMAIVVSSLTSETVDPAQMTRWAYEHGYWCSKSGSYHTLIPGAAQAWGLSVEGCTASEPQRILDALADGKLVVALMTKGHFTKSGHFIVLRGVQDEKILVADPASYRRSQKAWDLSIILNEASRRAGAGGPFWIIG